MFKLFSPRDPAPSTAMPRADFSAIEEERATLTRILYASLESLSNSYNGQDNIQSLCNAIMETSTHVRLIWIGFCANDAATVPSYIAVGEMASAGKEFRLPKSCFDFVGPYSQAAIESSGTTLGACNDLNSLFSPWQQNMEACPASSALALPLRTVRSDKGTLRGLIVFYADDIDYFSRMGSAPFKALSHLAEIIWQQSNLMQMLTQKAQFDQLTGMMNRRKMMHVLKAAITHAEAAHEALSIMICRVEGFDKINASYGWVAADAILVGFSKEIIGRIRPQDSVGRWTNVEFIYVLPRTEIIQAKIFAQGLQAYFLGHPVVTPDCSVCLPLNFGVASYVPTSNGLEDLIQQASQDLSDSIENAPASI